MLLGMKLHINYKSNNQYKKHAKAISMKYQNQANTCYPISAFQYQHSLLLLSNLTLDGHLSPYHRLLPSWVMLEPYISTTELIFDSVFGSKITPLMSRFKRVVNEDTWYEDQGFIKDKRVVIANINQGRTQERWRNKRRDYKGRTR